MYLAEVFPMRRMSGHAGKLDTQMSTHFAITRSRNTRQVVIVDDDHIAVRRSLCNVLGRILYAA